MRTKSSIPGLSLRSVVAAVLVAIVAAGGLSIAGLAGTDPLVWAGLLAVGASVNGGGIDRLTEEIRRLGEGEYDIDPPADWGDELGPLWEAVETVADRLRDGEATLREERTRFEDERHRRSALFENTTDPVARLRIGEDLRVEEVNSRFVTAFDTSAETAVGQSLTDCLGGGETVRDALADVGPGAAERELRLPGEDGWRTFQFQFVPIPPREGETPDEGYAVFVDITDRLERERSERLRKELYRITSDPTLGTEAKIERLLERGCEWFGLDNGFLSDIDLSTGEYHVEQAVGDEFVDAGTTIPLEQTFCRRAIDTDDILGIYDAVEEGYADDPGYADSGIRCYFGARVEVQGDPYGTFCFFEDDPLARPFSHVDRAVLDLMARWVSYELERRERERELRLKDRAMGAAPVGITITDATDPDHPIVHVNEQFARLTGYDADEIRGRSHEFLYSPGTDSEAVAAVQSALDDERATTVEFRNYRQDGTEFWTRTSLAPVADESGTVTHFVHFREDITDRVEDQRRLSAIVENTDNPIYIKDLDGVYQFVNEATADVFGLPREAVVGKTDADLFDQGSVADVRAADHLVTETGEAVTRETATTVDGTEHVWLDNKYPYRDSDGEIIGLMGISKGITDRKRRERELERYERILESIDDIAFVVDEDRRLSYINERIEDYIDVQRDAVEGESLDALATEYIVSGEDRATFDAALDQAFAAETRSEGPDGIEIEVSFGGDRRIFDYQFSPLLTEETVRAVAATVRDVTRRKAQAAALQSLHDTTRELLTIEREDAVAELVVETGGAILESAAVALYRYDNDANALEPVAHTDAFAERTGGAPSVAVGGTDSKLWEAFVTGNPSAFDDPAAVEEQWVAGADIDGGLLVPVGDHGVFVVASPEPTVDDRERQLVETLAATTEAAFDRLESEAELRERESELRRQNERLERQVRATDLIRGVDQSLVGADSREEIERAVCDRLAAAEDIAFAWIGDGEPLRPRTWAGADAGDDYLDAVSLAADSREPAVRTRRTGEPTVVDSVPDRLTDESWAEPAAASGFGSVLSVPLAVGDHTLGVLTVYGTSPDTFDDFERDVFAELGATIASSVEAVQARRALQAERYVELELTVTDADTVLARLAEETGTPIEFRAAATASDEATRLFVTTDAPPDTVEGVLADMVSVTDHRQVATTDDGRVFEVTVTGTPLPAALAKAGGKPRSVRAEGTDVTAVVDVPAETAVRTFVDRLSDRHGEVQLERRREVERPTQTRAELVASLLDGLTDRQRETLRTAYFAGFFDWPRESTGEDVAEMLDVTQPTVNRHLRLGQRALLEALFESEGERADTS